MSPPNTSVHCGRQPEYLATPRPLPPIYLYRSSLASPMVVPVSPGDERSAVNRQFVARGTLLRIRDAPEGKFTALAAPPSHI